MNLALAVDFGGTKVEAALVDETGRVLPQTRFREPTGPRASTSELAASVDAVLASVLGTVPEDGRLVGAGVGSAGPVDVAGGLVSPLNVPAWRGYPLLDQVRSHLGDVPARLRMDGLCITLAEHWVGAAQGFGNVMGMIVSTGVGGGLILNGLTVPGPTGNGAEERRVGEIPGLDRHHGRRPRGRIRRGRCQLRGRGGQGGTRPRAGDRVGRLARRPRDRCHRGRFLARHPGPVRRHPCRNRRAYGVLVRDKGEGRAVGALG